VYDVGIGKLSLYCVDSLNNARLQMWADPATCRTVHQGGLPPDRGVKVYGFAPPYVLFATQHHLLSSNFLDVS
jgi:hypothetical protein